MLVLESPRRADPLSAYAGHVIPPPGSPAPRVRPRVRAWAVVGTAAATAVSLGLTRVPYPVGNGRTMTMWQSLADNAAADMPTPFFLTLPLVTLAGVVVGLGCLFQLVFQRQEWPAAVAAVGAGLGLLPTGGLVLLAVVLHDLGTLDAVLWAHCLSWLAVVAGAVAMVLRGPQVPTRL